MRPLGLLLLLNLLWLAACQQAPAPPAAPAAADLDTREPVTPKVQRLVLAVPPPATERPRPTNGNTTDIWHESPAYEYLWGVSPDGAPNVPQLATEWNLEPDGKTFRFKLRKGVPFHYGKGEFTAQDVLYSWQMLIAPDSLERRERWESSVPNVEIVNDFEVLFHLARPDQAFLWSFGEADAGLEIMSKVDGERKAWTFDETPVAGTGPYAIKEWRPSEFIRFERSTPKHYRRTPDFPEFEYRYVRENSTRLAALLSREVQIAALPLDLMSQAEARGFKAVRGRADVGFQTFVTFVGPWVNKKYTSGDPEPIGADQAYRFPQTPLLDKRVLKALNKAINRDELNKAFFKGLGTPIYNVFFHPSRPGWNPAWERNFQVEYGYDPDAARKLLAEAGYGPNAPLEHTILTRSYGLFPELLDIVEAIANYWRRVGVQVTIDSSDGATQGRKMTAQEYDNHSYIAGTSVRQFFGFGSYGAGNGYVGGRIGAEFIEPTKVYSEELRWTFDEKQADAIWRRIGDQAYDLHAPAPLFWLPVFAVVDPSIVADYRFSGSRTGTYTNAEYIYAAK